MSVEAPASLSGVGTVTSADGLDNAGTVTPGVSGVHGTLTLVGNYYQDSTGTLVINIDSVGNFGKFNVQGTATLAGTLTVNKNADYQPPFGTDLVFMPYTSHSGSFGTVNISNNQWQTSTGIVEFQANPTTSDYELDTAYL